MPSRLCLRLFPTSFGEPRRSAVKSAGAKAGRRRVLFFLGALAAAAALGTGRPSLAQAKRSLSFVDLLNIPRVADPQLSPDGRLLTFTLQTTDWPGNRRVYQIWESRADGAGLHKLTSGASAVNARWSPDGTTIAYLTSTRMAAPFTS
jgi:hypothetical protein